MNKVTIANLALTELGQASIAGFDEQNDRARKVSIKYDPARRSLLRSHFWEFAKVEENLARISLGTDKSTGRDKEYSPEYPYIYKIPAKALLIRKVFTRGNEKFTYLMKPKIVFIPEINQKCIVSHEKHLMAQYTADIEDCNIYDSLFVDVFSLYLASELAIPLTGDSEKAALVFQKYKMRLAEAEIINRNEDDSRPHFESAALNSRGH